MAVASSASAPASPDGLVSACGSDAAGLQDTSLVDPTLPPQPFPLPLPSPDDLPSPLQERRPDLSLSFAADVLPSTAVSLSTPPVVKNAHNLRLPSFDLLGIANPHPDRPNHSISSFSPLGAGPLSKPEDPLHVLSPPLGRHHKLDGSIKPFAATPPAARAHVEHLVPVITPPAEPGTVNWGSFVNVRPAGLGSPPGSDPGVTPNLTTTANASSTVPNPNFVVPTVSAFDGALGMEVWVQRIQAILGRCTVPEYSERFPRR